MHLLMFDVDGTLTDTHRRDAEFYAGVVCEVIGLPEHALDTRWEHYRDVTDSGITGQLLERHGLPAECAEEVQRRFVAHLAAAPRSEEGPFREIPGARDLLDHLKRRSDVQLAIATGTWRGSAAEKLGQAGFDLSHLPMATSDDSHRRVQIMRTARDRAAMAAGVDAFESITYVGDAVWDVQATAELGWPFIGRADGPRAEVLRDRGALHILPDFRDRQALLRAWAKVREHAP